MSLGVSWRDEESGWVIRAGADTHIGYHRQHNDDGVWLDPELPLVLVLDGLGGRGADRPRQVITEAIRERAQAGFEAHEAPEELLESAFRSGHQAVLRLHNESAYRGLAATVAAAWVQDGRVFVAWLGNAGAYRQSALRIERLTHAHTFREDLVRQKRMTEAQVNDQLIRNAVVRYLGRWDREYRLDVLSFTPLQDDRVILATDGVTQAITDPTILSACRLISDPTTCAEAILEHSLRAGSRDNCTCAVIAFEWASDAPPLAPPEPEPPKPLGPPRKWWRFWK